MIEDIDYKVVRGGPDGQNIGIIPATGDTLDKLGSVLGLARKRKRRWIFWWKYESDDNFRMRLRRAWRDNNG